MRVLSISISLIILSSCSSELDRCIEVNIDEPPTYTLKSLMDERNETLGEYRTPIWKNSADRKIYNCITFAKDNTPSYETFNYKIRVRNCIQQEEDDRKAKAKAFCHDQGIY